MRKKLLTLVLVCILLLVKNGHSQGVWTSTPSGTSFPLLGVSAPTFHTCYVCGANGTIRKTINSGSTWTPITSGTLQHLYSVHFTDSLVGYVVGDNGVALKTINGGAMWSAMPVGTTVALRNVYFFDANNGFISGAGGLILNTTNAGVSWTPVATGTASNLSSTFFTSSTTGYATGASGTAIKSASSGTTWSPLTSGVTSSLEMVQFTTATNGIICGDSGVVLRTTNAGTSWTPVTTTSSNALTGMDFFDTNNGFIVGGDVSLNTGIILKTTDGGASWTSSVPGTPRLTRVDFYDGTRGFAVGFGGTILRWTISVPANAAFTTSSSGCVGQSMNFYSVMTGVSGLTESWNFGTGATPATSTSSSPTGIVYSSSGAKTVTHITTTPYNSDTVTSVITVNPSPTASFTSTAPACPGSNINFTNTGSSGAGYTYMWDFGGATPNISTVASPTGISYFTGGTKTITFNVTSPFGCTTTTTQTITIDSLPIANAGADSIICFNTSVTIGDSSLAGFTYSWTPSSSLNNDSISNPIATPINSSTSYILTVTNTTTGCINKDTVEITMQPALAANAGINGEICMNDSIEIGSTFTLGQTYSWSPGANLSDSTLSDPMATPTATTTYTLTVSGFGCPIATDEVTITVNNFLIGSAGMDDTTTSGTPIQLNASGGISYAWSPAATLDNPGIYNPMASPMVTTTYTVIITDINGCKLTDAVKITVVDPAFWVPTAFSPDGNGSSDVFYVRGEGILNFEFTIYNRWGERIFFTKDINTGWDGTRQSSGDKLPEGAYVYQIRGILSNGKEIDTKGMINLIR